VQTLNIFWEEWDGKHRGTCIDIAAMAHAHGVINIIMDIEILALSMSQEVGLRMPHWKKIWVMCVFCMVKLYVFPITLNLSTEYGPDAG